MADEEIIVKSVKAVKIRLSEYNGVPYTVKTPEIVYVKSLLDLPAPIGYKIYLESKHYIFLNSLSLAYNLVPGANTRISGNNMNGSTLSFNGGTVSFEDDGIVPYLETLVIENLHIKEVEPPLGLTLSNRKIFHLWSSYKQSSIRISNCTFTGGSLGELDGRNVIIENCNFRSQFQGMNCTTNLLSFRILNCVFQDWQNLPGTVMVNIGTAENLHISDCIFKPEINETIFDFTDLTEEQSVMVSSNQLHILGETAGQLLTPTSKTKKDPEIIFIGNSNVADSTMTGLIIMEKNMTATPLTLSIPTKILGTYKNTNALCERMTYQSTGSLLVTGNASQLLTANGNATIINNNAVAIDYEVTIYINGAIAGSGLRSWDTVEPGKKSNLSFNGLVEVNKYDLIECYIKNTTNSDPLLVEGISLVLNK